MTRAIGSNYVGNAATAYASSVTTPKVADTAAKDADMAPQKSGSDSVTLSEAAKAYLAANAATDSDGATLTANARAWFDQQYQKLGLTSAMLDGQIAVDLSGQSRATLAAVASNRQGLFTPDEIAAAAQTLQSRLDDAMMPHVVIARHTGDYASLYQAASDYLDEAGADERATVTWQTQKQAVLDGLAMARTSFNKAPDTENADDPVRALLDKTSRSDPSAEATDGTDVAASARAMLDAQANKARDEGMELVFDRGRNVGLQADFSDFDNQSLAVVALNQDATFSSEESRAARQELDQRNRTSILNAFDTSQESGSPQDASVALLSLYSNMSASEKAALGYTDAFQDRIIQSYQSMSKFQSGAATGTNSMLGLSSYL